ncbi:hypothetical protein N658DRAFT_334621 [Parathielavia hyrcaniae]|uniref:Uncharacterized protein n=1 Tax=Parathielavia hyrcaniae TaxID=113614 RepID=A0AAN6PWB5_9PEZI|nr:hypothetical protein N658DRAFT_334621 [Parathielavia hyrcaniae]
MVAMIRITTGDRPTLRVLCMGSVEARCEGYARDKLSWPVKLKRRRYFWRLVAAESLKRTHPTRCIRNCRSPSRFGKGHIGCSASIRISKTRGLRCDEAQQSVCSMTGEMDGEAGTSWIRQRLFGTSGGCFGSFLKLATIGGHPLNRSVDGLVRCKS